MKRFIDFLLGSEKPAASIAKERLQIIISHERGERSERKDPEYLLKLKEEIIQVIAKYVQIDPHQVSVQWGHVGENAVLELNITMPENTLQKEEAVA